MIENLRWLGHSSFLITGEKKVYIDPFSLPKGVMPKANIILITHPHYDHFSMEDLKEIVTKDTVIIGPKEIQAHLKDLKQCKFMQIMPDKELTVGDINIHAVPAYNLNNSHHKKESGWVGYIVQIEDLKYYFAGDTDRIPEMKKIGSVDIAMLPVSGIYTMDYQNAILAAEDISPKIVIPMHYGSIIGSKLDAEKFVKEVQKKGIKSVMLEAKKV
jgi:L-ascorbate metabolism protein UlaG (beta-lactamase superfamily)